MPTKILLADDSVTIQKVVELTFSDGDYEVSLTNNGVEAIEAIPSVSPDLILSDIIMPEKNGYELCEFVKSHPEYKSIPVILLTGTFDPFDPERAEKAGCDAVVTKPFESQSLIQKVEELLKSAGSGGETPMSPGETIPAGTQSPFAESDGSAEVMPPPSPPEPEQTAQPQEDAPAPQGDVFEQQLPDVDDDGATRMIPKMSLEDLQRMQQQAAETPAAPESAPAADSAAEAPGSASGDESPFGGETELPPPPAAQAAGSAPFNEPQTPPPFGAPPAEPTGPLADQGSGSSDSFEDDATRMIPKMSLEDIQRMQQERGDGDIESTSSSESAPAFESGGFSQPDTEAPVFGEGDAQDPPPTPETEEPAFGSSPSDPGPSTDEASPFGEQPAGESDEDSSTRMIPKMSLEDIQRMQQEAAAGSSEDATSVASEQPSPSDAPVPSIESEQPEPIPSHESDSGPEESAPGSQESPLGPDTAWSPSSPEQDHSSSADESARESAFSSGLGDTSAANQDLSNDDMVEQVARRVVEMLSDSVIREIAWDVIPETAERVVRERVSELESSQD